MFNITHTAKPGQCKRRRCSRPAVEQGLCEKDLSEWRAAGSPPFSSGGTALTGVMLATYGTREALAESLARANQSMELVQSWEIVDQATMDVAGQFLAGVRETRADFKRQMDEALKPLKAALEQQKELYQPLDRRYAEIEDALRAKMNAHTRATITAQEAALKAVEAAGGTVDQHTLVVAHGIENVALPVGMGTRDAWIYEVTDEAALRRGVAMTEVLEALQAAVANGTKTQDQASALFYEIAQVLGLDAVAPRECLTTAPKALATLARERKNDANIPGVKVSLQTSVVAARRRA